MRRLFTLCVLCLAACQSGSALVSSEGPTVSQDDALCAVPGVSHKRVFPALKFREPTALVQAPSTNRWYVVEKQGVIRSFDNVDSTAAATVFADLTARTHADWEEGMFSIAFDPHWPSVPEAYVTYTGFGGRLDY